MVFSRGLLGFSDFRMARIDDIIIHLNTFKEKANKLHVYLEDRKKDFERNFDAYENPNDIKYFLLRFLTFTENFSAELHRLSSELQYSIREQHVASLRQIHELSSECDAFCIAFKRTHIISTKNKNNRKFAELIYGDTKGLMAEISIEIGNMWKRLEVMVGSKYIQNDPKEIKEDQLTDYPLIPKKVEVKPNEKFEDFIRGLELRFETDDQISLKEPGKMPKSFTCQSLGFRDNSTQQWKEFTKILKNPQHTYSTGPSHINNLRSKPYDSKQKIMREINKKIINFFNAQFNLKIPKTYKLYASCPSEKPGTYRFKFQIGFDYGHEQSYYDRQFESLSKTEMIDEICKLHEEHQKSGDDEVIEKLSSAFMIAKTKHNMSESEIRELIKPEKEQYKYDPYENQEDRQPDY